MKRLLKYLSCAGALAALTGAVLIFLNSSGLLSPVIYTVSYTLDAGRSDKIEIEVRPGELADISDSFINHSHCVLGLLLISLGGILVFSACFRIPPQNRSRFGLVCGLTGAAFFVAGGMLWWGALQITKYFSVLATTGGADPSMMARVYGEQLPILLTGSGILIVAAAGMALISALQILGVSGESHSTPPKAKIFIPMILFGLLLGVLPILSSAAPQLKTLLDQSMADPGAIAEKISLYLATTKAAAIGWMIAGISLCLLGLPKRERSAASASVAGITPPEN